MIGECALDGRNEAEDIRMSIAVTPRSDFSASIEKALTNDPISIDSISVG